MRVGSGLRALALLAGGDQVVEQALALVAQGGQGADGGQHRLVVAFLAPLLLAGLAFLTGTLGAWLLAGVRRYFALAVMMVLFLNAARIAMITFDPYLASRPLAEAWKRSPPGQVIIDNQYYTFSSVFFYGRVQNALLLNGRVNNLEYGSYEPGAPRVFLDDAEFARRWTSPARYYLFIEGPAVERVTKLLPRDRLIEVAAAGGKYLFTNQPR